MTVSLREVRDDDLPTLFAHQADPASSAMAGVPSRDQPAFDAHWAKIRADPLTLIRAVIVDGEVAGQALSFLINGRREVGYWLDKAYWGRGIASAALAQLLEVETRRPLYGHLLKTNAASRRVLERNGFVYVADDGPADILMILTDPAAGPLADTTLSPDPAG